MADEPATNGEKTVVVELSFTMARSDVERLGGDDFKGHDQGITAESCAISLLREHDPKYGYIHFKVSTKAEHAGRQEP